MNEPIGHDLVREMLEKTLPPVTLLRGPASIGKWTLARYLAAHHRVGEADLFLHEHDVFGVPESHNLLAWSHRAPFGRFKLAVVNLTDARQSAFHLLLKTIEEPPPKVKFLFVTSYWVPATFASRCVEFVLGPLPEDQLRQVLLRLGLSKPVAEHQAKVSQGRVAPALARTSDDQYEIVLGVIKAIARRDVDLFTESVAQFSAASRDLLHRWLVEAMTGERVLFRDEDMFGLAGQGEVLTNMMRRLSMAPASSARLQVRVALEPFLAT